MDGKIGNGNWRIVVTDEAQEDTGTLNGWALELCYTAPTTLALSWDGGDPDGDPVTYTVAFGTSSPPPVVDSVTGTYYNPGTLAEGTLYYWRITATDGMSTTVGPLWSFTTVGRNY